MKKLALTLGIISALFLISCTKSEPEVNDELEEVEGLEELVAQVQLDFPSFIVYSDRISARLTRLNYLFGITYESELQNNHPINGILPHIWDIAYTNLLPSIDEALLLTEDTQYFKHRGVLKILKAYTLLNLVDIFDDVPYSKINSPNPQLDDAASVYAAAKDLLDQAMADLDLQAPDLENDFYYNNDALKWIKLANTLKMRIYLNTRLIDNNAISNFEAIAASGNYISSQSDDFEYHFGNNNDIHPDFDMDYNNIGASRYRSNWLMDKMVNSNDPRIRYYFYRQTQCTPGNVGANGNYCEPSEPSLSCSTDNPPAHYTSDMVFCSVANGYWGRDHGFSDGIPPDGLLRSVAGLYPFAGKFDDDSFLPVEENMGGNGLGIVPILLSSWVDFMRSEMALVDNNSSLASTTLESGMQKSIDKTMDFISVDPSADITFVPTSQDVSDYISGSIVYFNSASSEEKWNFLAEQNSISQYGSGLLAYNFYRRTGYPNTLQYHISVDPGPFVRSLYYPQEVVDNNPNIDQKPNTAVQVFWDNNPSYPSFPYSN